MRGVFGVLFLCTGCAGSVELTRVVRPNEAMGSQTTAVAILRDGERLELPAGTLVRGGRAVFAHGEPATLSLDPSDTILRDDEGHITAVRSNNAITRFVVGTAESLGSSAVRGELDSMPLRSGDEVEVRGRFAPGDSIPGGGRVESSRWTGALVAGIGLFGLAYIPTVYVGAQSAADRSLFWPIAGPWMDLASRPACVPPQLSIGATLPFDPSMGDTAIRVALAASGAIQGLGALLMLVGLPSHAEVHGDRVHVSVVPTGAGAAAFGTF